MSLRLLWRRHWKKVAFAGVALWAGKAAVRRYRWSLEREEICEQAKALGHEALKFHLKVPHLTVIMYDNAARGDSREVFKKHAAPVFHLAGIDFETMHTKHAGEAKEKVQKLDLTKTNGIVVVGGDGLLQEVVSGLLNRPDRDEMRERIPIGIIPTGSANVVANSLHQHPSSSQASVVGRAALAIAENRVLKTDVLAVIDKDTQQCEYGLVSFGWGVWGGWARRGRKHRFWRSHRYDMALFLMLLREWPLDNVEGILRFQDVADDGTTTDGRPLAPGAHVLAALQPDLGLGRPLFDGPRPDHAMQVITLNPEITRGDMVSLARNMGQGKSLSSQAGVESRAAYVIELDPVNQPVEAAAAAPTAEPGAKDAAPSESSEAGAGSDPTAAAPGSAPAADSAGQPPAAEADDEPGADAWPANTTPLSLDGNCLPARPVRVQVAADFLTLFAAGGQVRAREEQVSDMPFRSGLVVDDTKPRRR